MKQEDIAKGSGPVTTGFRSLLRLTILFFYPLND